MRFLFLIFLLRLSAGAQSFEWAHGFSSPLFNTVNSTAISSSGKLLVTGQFQLNTSFPSGILTSAGSRDVFVSEYDTNGTNTWTRRYGGSGYDEPFGLKGLADGGILLCGQFRGTTSFGNFQVESRGQNDAFLLKTDSAGDPIWLKTIGGLRRDVAFGVAADADQNLYVGGFFQDSVQIDGTWIRGSGFHHLFVASFSPEGNLRWFRSFRSSINTTDDEILDLEVSGNRVLIGGFFSGSLDFGGNQQVSAGMRDGFVATMDLAGNPLWFRRVGGSGEDFVYAVDSRKDDGRVFATGSSMGGSFGSVSYSVSNPSLLDVVLVSCDSAGEPIWVRNAGTSTGHSQGNHLTVSDSGVFVTGLFRGTLSFPGTGVNRQTRGGYDAFVARYSMEGNLRWALTAGSTGDDGTKSVSVSRNRVFIAGDGGSGIQFGGQFLVLGGSTNGVVACLKDSSLFTQTTDIFRPGSKLSLLVSRTPEGWVLKSIPEPGQIIVYDFQGRILFRRDVDKEQDLLLPLSGPGLIRYLGENGAGVTTRF